MGKYIGRYANVREALQDRKGLSQRVIEGCSSLRKETRELVGKAWVASKVEEGREEKVGRA